MNRMVYFFVVGQYFFFNILVFNQKIVNWSDDSSKDRGYV